MKNFKNKVATITGAASGIGFSLAKALAEAGADLVLTDINQKALTIAKEKLSEFPVRVITQQGDVSQYETMKGVADIAFSTFGQVDILFNNAGIFTPPKFIWECTENEWDRHLDINLKGVINGIRAFMPRLLQQNRTAHIVNTASLAGHVIEPCFAPYHASKFGVVAISESLKLELEIIGNTNIHIAVACPGFVKTNILGDQKGFEEKEEDLLGTLKKNFTDGFNGRGLDANEVARQILEAMSNKQFYIFTHDFSEAVIGHRMHPIMKGKSASLREDQIADYGVAKIQEKLASIN